MQHISGPLPSPDILKKYEEISPGIANRLIKIAEDEALHRRKMEAEVIAVQSREQSAYRTSEMLGQVFGLVIGLTAIIAAIIMALHGAQLAASFIGTGGVTSLVTAFILGRTFLLKFRQQEMDHQRKAIGQDKKDSPV